MNQVHYYYKKQTKYPPRIYVFMNGELWLDRNRRTMGLGSEFPFLKRQMNSEEIEYEKSATRLHAYQYDSWAKLIEGEIMEAIVSSNEAPGSGSAFLKKLMKFKDKYPLQP